MSTQQRQHQFSQSRMQQAISKCRKTVGLAAVAFLSLTLGYGVKATAGWEEEWERTVAAAEKEGRVVLYVGSGPLTKHEPTERFQKAYPKIRVTTVRGRGYQIGPRIFAERRADRYIADLVVTGKNTAFVTLYAGNILDPIKPTLILPEVVDQSKWWQGKHKYADRAGKHIFVFLGNAGGANIAYNTNLVDGKTLKSYRDLINPKWKGKIVAYDPRVSGMGTTSIFFYYHPALGPDFMRRLYGEMDLTIVRNYRQATDWLGQNKFSLCIPCTNVDRAIQQGLPIALALGLKEGRVMSSKGGTLSLVNRAPHPNAAKVFINWLLSREGQIQMQKGGKARATEYDSLRVDIPKDIAEDVRRKEGVAYFDSDDPRFADRRRVDRLLKEILK